VTIVNRPLPAPLVGTYDFERNPNGYTIIVHDEMVITFEVLGIPMPQGSKKAFVANGRAMMKESGGDKHAQWRNAVANAAKDVAGHDDVSAPLDAAMHVVLDFRFPMPKSRTKSQRAQGEIAKTTAPDVDKLARAVLDGLQAGGLIRDDALVSALVVTKSEVVGWSGVTITIKEYAS
jgi:crossover junction endodeoxyribonuclease RusA